MPECPSCHQEVITSHGTFPWHVSNIYRGAPCLGIGRYPKPSKTLDGER